MKAIFLVVSACLSLMFIYGCGAPEKTSNTNVLLIDSMNFRRSYAGLTSMSDAEAEAVASSNPVLSGSVSGNMKARLRALGLLKGDSLLLSGFSETDMTVFNGKYPAFVNIDSCRDEDCSKFIVTIHCKDVTERIYLTRSFGESFKLSKADVIPGGFEELLIMKQYYLMNGDNFDVYLYQLHD